MGRANAHTMVLKIFSAFSGRKKWTQADLARHTEVRSEHVARVLGELVDQGWRFERTVEHPQVVWRAPERFLPGVLLVPDDVHQLFVLLRRLKPSASRDAMMARLKQAPRDAAPPVEIARTPDDVRTLIEWTQSRRVAVELDYRGHNDVRARARFVSVHHIGDGEQMRFLAVCHSAKRLKHFRFDNIERARVAREAPFIAADADEVEATLAESFDGYHSNEPPVKCVFYVRQRDAAWVARNLPGELHPVPDGDEQRFEVTTSGVRALARMLVGLGDAVRVETPELRAVVVGLARGVLGKNEG